ncbi:MAG: sugar kinase [Anaerolineae bacterium]|nr:sugar kinase [Anaerolineae bacterium]
MMRLQPPGFERFTQARSFNIVYGGGEANVAVSLANFGIRTRFVTRLPNNELGDACLNYIRQHGVSTDAILRGGERLGLYFCENGASQRGSKVIYDRANSSFATLQPGMIDWEAALQEADWFHFTGITPAVSQGAAETCLEALRAARAKGIPISCDLNFRKNLWKWGKSAADVMPGLVEYVDIAIGNEEDADKVFGIKAPEVDVQSGKVSADSYRTVAEKLAERFPQLKKVAITLRGSLSASHNTWSGVLWDRSGTFHSAPTYDIQPIVDRVGGGDAFAGGLIYGLLTKPEDDGYAVRYAVAASCLKHSIPGDFNLASRSEIEALRAGDGSGRVAR